MTTKKSTKLKMVVRTKEGLSYLGGHVPYGAVIEMDFEEAREAFKRGLAIFVDKLENPIGLEKRV